MNPLGNTQPHSLQAANQTEGIFAGRKVSVNPAEPRRTDGNSKSVLVTFAASIKKLFQHVISVTASSLKRFGNIGQSRQPSPVAATKVQSQTLTDANALKPSTTVTRFHAYADKLPIKDTALINEKMRAADDQLVASKNEQSTKNNELGRTSNSKLDHNETIKDGLTNDFVKDLKRANYFWQSESGELVAILDKSALANEADPAKKDSILQAATNNLHALTAKAHIDENTLLRVSHQAHQGIFGILSGVLQKSDVSALALKSDTQAKDLDDQSITLAAGTNGQLAKGQTENSYIFSSDDAGGIKVVATSTITEAQYFTSSTLPSPIQLNPENSSITLSAEFVIPKDGDVRLIQAGYNLNLDFVQ